MYCAGISDPWSPKVIYPDLQLTPGRVRPTFATYEPSTVTATIRENAPVRQPPHTYASPRPAPTRLGSTGERPRRSSQPSARNPHIPTGLSSTPGGTSTVGSQQTGGVPLPRSSRTFSASDMPRHFTQALTQRSGHQGRHPLHNHATASATSQKGLHNRVGLTTQGQHHHTTAQTTARARRGHTPPYLTSRESHRRSPSSYGRSPAPRRQPGRALRDLR